MEQRNRELIVAWQDPTTRTWLPVARFGRAHGRYYFVYTEGAKTSESFQPFGWLRSLESAYLADEIFPLFANRLLPKSRPDYKDYIRWLGLDYRDADELEVLSRSGGVRATDRLEIFPCPAPDEHGNYVDYFFSHGLRYLLPEHLARLKDLKPGDQVYAARDIQNPVDPKALLLRTADPVSLIGYCPRYLAAEFGVVIDAVGAENFIFTIHQINLDAPNELRVLCKVQSPWPSGHLSCTTGLYRPLVDLDGIVSFARLTKETGASTVTRDAR